MHPRSAASGLLPWRAAEPPDQPGKLFKTSFFDSSGDAESFRFSLETGNVTHLSEVDPKQTIGRSAGSGYMHWSFWDFEAAAPDFVSCHTSYHFLWHVADIHYALRDRFSLESDTPVASDVSLSSARA
jgi:hypothetical protein